MASLDLAAQNFKDTVFVVGSYSCACRYNLNAEDDKGIFDLHEKPAQYPGGDEVWKKFVKKNLDKSLKGKDKVEVRFEIDKNGDLSNFEIMTSSPAQKFNEVVRLLKSSGKWFPSVQKGFCLGSTKSVTLEL